MLSIARRVTNRGRRELLKWQQHQTMRGLKGIIHVGANLAQERDEYEKYGLKVVWIEPIPGIFAQLKEAISEYPRQRAIQYLVLNRDDEQRTLHIADNHGASSSILEFGLHKDIWPSVRFTRDIQLTANRLDTIVVKEAIDLAEYDALILDTQGSELLVLQGADRVLRQMKIVKVEVADFDSYVGCPRPEDIFGLLKRYGFCEKSRVPFAAHTNGGRYFDITYSR